MTHIRDVLDEEMGIPPASTVDLDQIIARQRRRHRLRQTGFGVSTGALAVGVTLIATTVVGATSGGHHSAPAAGGPGAPAQHAAVAKLTPSGPRATEAQRLSDVLARLAHSNLPGATFAHDAVDGSPDERFGAPLVFTDAGPYFVAGAQINDAAGASSMVVRVGRTDDALVQEHGCVTDPPPKDLKVTCVTTQLGGGSYFVAMHTTRGAFQRDLAEVVRPGGQVVDVEIANSIHFYKASRPQLNLTPDQLKAIALDPSLATSL